MIFKNKIIQLYKSQLFTRCDDTGNVFYFSKDNFTGLNQEPYPFQSSKGHQLQGYFYHYDNYVANRVIVFDHGHGGGHLAYMKEIELLCKHGFLVFAYDHTGCMQSGGEFTNGFTQSLVDLNDCLTTLKADEKYKNHQFSVIGHSWGAYSCLNIAALHPDITHVVAISGFISVEEMIKQNFSGLLKGYQKDIFQVEESINPSFVHHNALKTLSKTTAKVLLIYSEDDKMVKKEIHYDALKEKLDGKENIHFLLEKNKGHSPNYTEDAVKYKDAFVETLNKKVKKKELETTQQKQQFIQSFDWERMTKQDEKVWDTIFNHLDN